MDNVIETPDEGGHEDPACDFWAAFAVALDLIDNVECDRWNDHRKYAYASIGAIIEATRGPLAEVKILLVQEPTVRWEGAELLVGIVTRLIHTPTGWEDRSRLELPAKSPDLGGSMSAVTTAKRAALLAKFAITEIPPRGLLSALDVVGIRWRDFLAWAEGNGEGDPDKWSDENRCRCARWILDGGHLEISQAGERDRR